MKFIKKLFLYRLIKKELKRKEAGIMDFILETLLNGMSLYFTIDKEYRRNIQDFNARYSFVSKDGKIAAGAIFKNGKMKVKKNEIDNTNIKIIFKDGATLRMFLFEKDPDIIGMILDNQIQPIGNLNYLFKFGYMAKNLQLKFGL